MSSLLPLATETWDAAEYAALRRVMDSGRFTMGPEVKAFERAFAEHFGTRFAVMVNSGSSANLLMIAALLYHPERKLEANCEIIVPAVSWSTTFYPVHQLGMRLRFVDIDLSTLNMTVEDVERAITPDTRAVLAVNLLGNPCELDRLRALCDARGLVLLEDNCESMGAKLKERSTGTFGICGSFSTFFSHHISTMEGGVVVTNDECLYHVMLSLRAHGWLREQPETSHLHVDVDDFSRQFRFVLPGYNLRPLEMSGALGLEQLKKLPGIISARRDNAMSFKRIFSEHPGIQIQSEIGESSWFGFSMIMRGPLESHRARVVDAFRTSGIETRPIVAGNFLANPVIKYLNYSVAFSLPNAEKVDRDGLFIGNHHYSVENALVHAKKIIDSCI